MRLAELLKDLADGKEIYNPWFKYRLVDNQLLHMPHRGRKWEVSGLGFQHEDFECPAWEVSREKIKVRKKIVVIKNKYGNYEARIHNPGVVLMYGDHINIVYQEEIEWEDSERSDELSTMDPRGANGQLGGILQK